jgi:hypothetical protein
MAYELDIHYEGDVPGIEAHRLSVGAFGQPLFALLTALRRIATQMVSSAIEGESPKTGRFADPARNLDIEIVEINGNSLGLSTVVSFQTPPQPPQAELPIWADLPERAGIELLSAIERESRGQLTNTAVRKYLSSLPVGIKRQEYNLQSNGTPIRRIEIGDVKLTEMPNDLPFLRHATGNIVGVGFEPARSEIRIKPDIGAITSATATEQEVDRALEMRHEKIRTLTVHTTKGTRLISLKKATDPSYKFDPERARKRIFSRWDKVLMALSK